MRKRLTGTASKDKGHRLGAGYLFGGTTVSALWERLDFENSGTVAGVPGVISGAGVDSDPSAAGIGIRRGF